MSVVKGICLLLSAVLLSVSCFREPTEGRFDTDAEKPSASAFEPGHVRIFVESALAEQLTAASATGPATKSVAGIGEIRLTRTFPPAGKFEKRTREAGLDRWYDVWFDTATPLTKASEALEMVPGITEIEYRPFPCRHFEDQSFTVTPTPYASASGDTVPFNDPMFKDQWPLRNPGTAANSAAGCDIHVVPVWNAGTTGRPDIIVAVVDGGIDFAHEDLATNMWHDPDYPDRDIYGYNFFDDTTAIVKSEHGTHVAGIIAAVNNNGVGICGIAGGDFAAGQPGVRLMSCQIFKDGEKDAAGDPAQAIKWSADHGAVISQNSWGYLDIDYLPPSDIAAIDYFNTYAGFDEHGRQVGPMAGGLVVFAAGNEAVGYGSPAAYEEALSVAALGPDYCRAYYSNYGAWVDIAAPGGDDRKKPILSTLPGNQYGYMQGTSMACPHISGIAALILAKYGGPGFTRTMLWNRLVNTAVDISAKNTDKELVGGLVDAAAAFQAGNSCPPDPVSDFSATCRKADFIDFSLTVPADREDGQACGINIYYSPSPFSETARIPSKSFRTDSLRAGETMVGVLSGLAFETTFYLACEAYDATGNASPLSGLTIVTTGANHAPSVTPERDLTFTLKAHEKDTLRFRCEDEDGHGVHSWLENGSQADVLLGMEENLLQIEISAKKALPGTYTSLLHVFDDHEADSTVIYTYTILENHAPVAQRKVDDMLFETKGAVITVDLHDLFLDPDGENPVITVSSSDYDVANLHIQDKVLYVTSREYGNCTGTILATDGLGAHGQVDFRILSRDGSKLLDIYPTVVTNGKLFFRASSQHSLSIRIYSESGNILVERNLTTSPFSPAFLDISSLGAGTYSVVVNLDGETVSQTIIKL